MRDHEFVWIIEGHAIAHYDQQRIEAPSGSLLLCRPGMTDRYEWAAESRTIHAFFHFNFKLPRSGWPPPDSWPLIQRLPEDDILRPLFRYVLAVHSLPEPLRSSLLLPCVDLMMRSFVSGKLATLLEPHSAFPPPVEAALKLIRENTFQEPSPPLNLHRLARAAHVTPEHLCRIFQRTLRRSPMECLRLARLERAATLLARSNLAIKQVADSTAFASPYHFSRMFRKIHGLSPRDYRKATREGAALPSSPVPRAIPVGVFSKTR